MRKKPPKLKTESLKEKGNVRPSLCTHMTLPRDRNLQAEGYPIKIPETTARKSRNDTPVAPTNRTSWLRPRHVHCCGAIV